MSNPEKLLSHWKHLKLKHEELDKQIEEAYNHYDNDEKINYMKIEKLKLKTEMFEAEKALEKDYGKIIPGRH